MPIANYTTQSSVDKTMGEVVGALTRRGVTRISTAFDDNGEPAGLGFTMKTPYGLRDFALPIRTDGVLAALQREKVQPRYATREHAARVAWAIARDWLRAQSALIDAGLTTLDEVMFPWMVGGAAEQTAFEAYPLAAEGDRAVSLLRQVAPTRQSQPTSEELLAFEGKHPTHSGRKETAIRDELHTTPARFYQLLARLIWTEDALRIDPMLTHQLRRRAEQLEVARARRQAI